MNKQAIYTEKVGFMLMPSLKEALQAYCKEAGLTVGIVCRKALVKFLREKEALEDIEYI